MAYLPGYGPTHRSGIIVSVRAEPEIATRADFDEICTSLDAFWGERDVAHLHHPMSWRSSGIPLWSSWRAAVRRSKRSQTRPTRDPSRFTGPSECRPTRRVTTPVQASPASSSRVNLRQETWLHHRLTGRRFARRPPPMSTQSWISGACQPRTATAHPAHRRHGIGRWLLEIVEQRLRAAGAGRIDAMVLDANTSAHGLWSAAGYTMQDNWSRWVKPLRPR
jgi:hypothetical protein